MLARSGASNFHARRQRRYYRRARRQRACAIVEFGTDELDLLIRLKFLTDAQMHDRETVGIAMSKLLKALAKK